MSGTSRDGCMLSACFIFINNASLWKTLQATHLFYLMYVCVFLYRNDSLLMTIYKYETSSPKGNDAHLKAHIQSEKKWKDKFFRSLRAANSVVRGRIWPNFKLMQALMYVIITCKYEKDPIKNNQEKWKHRFSNYNTICCHGNQWSDLAEFRTHPSFYA